MNFGGAARCHVSALITISRYTVAIEFDGGTDVKHTLKAEAGAYAIAGASASMRLKTGFAFNHLQVAVKFARDAHEIEQANITKPFGPRFDGMMEVGAGISGNGRRGVGSQRKRGASEHAR